MNAPIPTTTLIPGLLVGIRTSIKGNVKYKKTDTDVRIGADGAEYSEWETERTVRNPKEQAAAVEVRSKARNIIVGVCAPTEFGLLCPEADRALLDEAFAKATRLCAEFNATAKTTKLRFNAIAGKIEPDDARAIRAINGEVRDLISEMVNAIEQIGTDPEETIYRIRAAAKRTTKLGNMLKPEMQEMIAETVKAAREQASKMQKAGDQAASVVEAELINRIASGRTAFLDLDDAVELQPAAQTTGRAIDLAPHAAPDADEDAPKRSRRKKTPEIDLD